jgi:class 3 adenylate cyclase/tetratricopeptide (TPR) repeat protein
MSACARCGEANPEDARYCKACGEPVSLEADQSSRRRVSVLFCDLVGSTELTERIDAEVMHGVMSRYWQEMRGVVERHGGRVEKFIGDAVVAVFGLPQLHEDDALRAVRAAADMRRALAALNDELAAQWGVTIRTRTGVATGEVVASGGAETLPVVGSIMNLAARLEQAAPPDEILIDHDTHRLVRPAVRAEPASALDLKGFAHEVLPFHLLAVEEGPREDRTERGEVPFVDRASEMRLLDEIQGDAAGTRRCRVVTIVGDAGIGKSRLVRELLRRREDRITVLAGRFRAYGEGPALLPVGEAIAGAAGLAPSADGPEARAKLAALVGDRDDADAVAAALGGIAGLGEPAPSPEVAFWAARSVLESIARRRALVLWLDDVQWADRVVLDFVHHVAEWSRDAPMLLLCSARPDLAGTHPHWGRAPGEVALRLEPLPEPDSRVLVRHLMHDEPAPELESRITGAAGGNPFFLEEIVASLAEEEALGRGGEHVDLVIPPTISALLAARIDRLAPGERAVLERAAVLGATFENAALEALAGDTSVSVPDAVRSLSEKELVTGSGRPGISRFRHDLTRDAAYAAIPKSRRADLHERAADLLTSGGDGPEFDRVAGLHLEEARRYLLELGAGAAARAASLGARAAEHLAKAGRAAAASGDVGATADLLDRAARLLPRADPSRLEILADLHDALLYAGRADAAGVAVAELLAELGPDAEGTLGERARMQQVLLRFLVDPGAIPGEELRARTDRAVEAFTAAGDDRNLATAHATRAMVAWLEGDAAAMQRHAERGLELARRSGNRRAMTDTAATLANALMRGPVPLADAEGRLQALLVELEGDPLSQAALRLDLSMILSLRGFPKEARAEADRAQEVFRDLGQRRWLARCSDVLADLAMDDEDATRAVELGRAVHAFFLEQGDAANALPAAMSLAGALLGIGRVDEADALAADVEREAPIDDLETQVEWRLVRGRAAAHRAEADRAIGLATEAIALSDGTDFLLMQADARADLGEVLQTLGRDAASGALRREAAERYVRKGAAARAERMSRELRSGR